MAKFLNSAKQSVNDTGKANKSPQNKKAIIIGVLAVILALLVAVALFVLPRETKPVETEPTLPVEITEPIATEDMDPAGEPIEPIQTETAETEAVIAEEDKLKEVEMLHATNPDVVGWLQIDGTVIDYPVVHTPQDEDKYLYANIEGKFSAAGSLLIDADCSLDPRSDNVIIHGHNMKKGTMFAILPHYETKTFWEEHPIIKFTTLDGTKEYEIVAAFYDRVYKKSENVFKFYHFVDAENRKDFNNAMDQFKNKALYETDVKAKYGDNLLTLSTCVYHVDNGRFVVVAREKK